MPKIPERIPPKLKPFWRYWNLGRYEYFQQERRHGSARLSPWIMSKQSAGFDELRSAINPNYVGRFVPAGHYVKLDTLVESAGGEEGWTMQMSDTPDEMRDHTDPILNARGRVLINGLGLGCVLNVLVHLKRVKHIDVVEINQDVIDLIAPFYDGWRKVKFHCASADEMTWPKGTRWNYAWHDIWSSINDDNLRQDGEPEHGISYERLHRKYQNRVERQDSWAFDIARRMRERDKYIDLYIDRWTFYFNNIASEEKRLQLLIEATAPLMINAESWKGMLTAEHSPVRQQWENLVKQSKEKISRNDAKWIVLDTARRWANQKAKMPA